MKRILFLAASVAMAASSSALAADAVEIIPEAPIAVEMPAPFSWSGPYIGVHGGYGWGDGEALATIAATCSTLLVATDESDSTKEAVRQRATVA